MYALAQWLARSNTICCFVAATARTSMKKRNTRKACVFSCSSSPSHSPIVVSAELMPDNMLLTTPSSSSPCSVRCSSSSIPKRTRTFSSKRSLFSENRKPSQTQGLEQSSKNSVSELKSTTTTTPKWRSLGVDRRELNLDTTLPTGQTFRWSKTGHCCYTGAIGRYLFTLRQIDGGDVEYYLHNYGDVVAAEEALRDFLNLQISLEQLWKGFSSADPRFRAVAPYISGARLLRQDPLECLFQFVCSSNNNIGRITQMVAFLSGFGLLLGTVEGIEFRAFPSLEELSALNEEMLREAGFGYRAKYIVGTVRSLNSKDCGGHSWLLSLRNLSLENAVDALCSLPGVGPKVASCIALFSLDQHHAVPVDTHVWQIATKYVTPELSGERLTPKLSDGVSRAFVERFGKYAGWAQTVLFIAELSSQQAMLPIELRATQERKIVVRKKRRVLADSEV